VPGVPKVPGRPGTARNGGPALWHNSPVRMLHIALLRAVNLGPHNKVGMADLRALASGLGFGGVQSLLHTGNLVFDGGSAAASTLERKLEAALERDLGLSTDVFVRTAREWKAMMAANPYPRDAADDPSHLVVLCLKSSPAAAQLSALRQSITGRERVQTVGAHAYLAYPDGIGTSRLTMDRIEKKLGTRGTGRNWNTVVKLAALAGVQPAS
jgi:uncharacterized protein (DUF1697 family)